MTVECDDDNEATVDDDGMVGPVDDSKDEAVAGCRWFALKLPAVFSSFFSPLAVCETDEPPLMAVLLVGGAAAADVPESRLQSPTAETAPWFDLSTMSGGSC